MAGRAFEKPGLVLVGTNMAMAQWRAGEKAAAEVTVRIVIGLSPGFQPAP